MARSLLGTAHHDETCDLPRPHRRGFSFARARLRQFAVFGETLLLRRRHRMFAARCQAAFDPPSLGWACVHRQTSPAALVVPTTGGAFLRRRRLRAAFALRRFASWRTHWCYERRR